MKLYAERVRLNAGGYDSRGRYWGQGAPLYRVSDEDGNIDEHVRASSAADARRKVQAQKGILVTPMRPKRTTLPKYKPHAFRSAAQSAREYRQYAKHQLKLARQYEMYARTRMQTMGPKDSVVRQDLRTAKHHRTLARQALERAKRYSGVWVDTCTKHKDCRMNPALGRACALASQRDHTRHRHRSRSRSRSRRRYR